MLDKNHDYGEAWARYEPGELYRSDTGEITAHSARSWPMTEKTLISEGIDSNYIDIINYALFALILIAGREA